MSDPVIIFRPDPAEPVSKAPVSPRVAEILSRLVDGGLYGSSPAEAIERLVCERLGQLEDAERARNPLYVVEDGKPPRPVDPSEERWCVGAPDGSGGYGMKAGPFLDSCSALNVQGEEGDQIIRFFGDGETVEYEWRSDRWEAIQEG